MSRWWTTRRDGRRRPNAWLVGAVVLGLVWWFGGFSRKGSREPPLLVRGEAAGRPALGESEPGPLDRAGWLEVLDQTLRKPTAVPEPARAAPLLAPAGSLPALSALTGMPGGGGMGALQASGPVDLPVGESFRVWFLDSVRTGHLPALVRLMVADDVRFGGRLILPRGVRLLGAVQGEQGDRLAVMVRQVQWPDGSSTPFAGQVVDESDGYAGVRAWVVPAPGWVQGLEVAEEAWGAAVGVLRARATAVTATPWASAGPDLRETVAEAAARAATAAGRTRAEEWRQRFPAYLEVRPGTEARVVVLQPFVQVAPEPEPEPAPAPILR